MENNILALDPASETGWALSTDIYGTWDLRTRSDESWGMKLIRFKSKFLEILNKEPIKLVAYERPAGRNTKGIITQSKIIAIIESECEFKGIQYRGYSATEIKKFATGKGNSGKPAMIEAASEKYDYEGDNDNIADALHLLHLAKSEYGDALTGTKQIDLFNNV